MFPCHENKVLGSKKKGLLGGEGQSQWVYLCVDCIVIFKY